MEYWIFILIIGMIIKRFFEKWDEISIRKVINKPTRKEYIIAPPIEEVLKEREQKEKIHAY